ncbi:MAG: gfo/Idh/MocA family oxidoreductase, partial [Oscillospiraceae bacterium]|nr:gfo/Idh/MocA family oxidoreductase [Oscillospiraceae bacterium]
RTDNPYGKCVWDFERDGNVDHQNVTVSFSNGAIGNFTLVGGSAKSERNIHIVGTKGEIKGTFEDSEYVIRYMKPDEQKGYTEERINLNVTGDMTGEKGAHGGGDRNLVLDFIDYINGKEPSVSCATLDDSVISHKTVFFAEQARKSGSVVKVTEGLQ